MKPILEPIHLGHQHSIVGFSYDQKNFITPWHFHPQHELTYIEESSGTKFVGDYVGAYEPGELVLLRSNLPHCWKNRPAQGVRARSIVIQWNTGVIPHVPELAGVREMLGVAARGILFEEAAGKGLLPRIRRFPRLSGPDQYLQLVTILLELASASYTTISEAGFETDLPSEYGNRMTSIHEFIELNHNRRIYLREVAEKVHMSEQSFSRFFTRMMGRSFFTFLNEYRINMAARMLSDTDESVARIAYACGYESLPFFHRKFGELHGMSPGTYRRLHIPGAKKKGLRS